MIDRRRERIAAVFAAACVLLLAGCPGNGDDPDDGNGNGEGVLACTFDHGDTAADATPLDSGGEQVSGFLCPDGDEDWFRIDVTAAAPRLSIALQMDGPLSPVSPTYVVRVDDGGAPGAVVATPPAGRTSGVHDDVHCLEPGGYFVTVRDRTGDHQDRRHPYALTLATTAHPDPAPRTFGPEDARTLTEGTPHEGAIACAGERNWWALEVPDRRIAEIRFTRDVAPWAPVVRLHHPEDGVLVEISDPSGSVSPTDLERLVVVPEAGTYYVEVAATDSTSAADTFYALTVSLIEDLDLNEPNDTPDLATDLGARSCTGSWSATASSSGTFGVPGDQDWFRLDLDGCDRGVLEAVVELDTSGLSDAEAWALQESLQASITVIRPHPASPCASAGECGQLQQACNSDWDCAGYGNTCQGGRCIGPVACLAEGVCAAAMVQRTYPRANTPATIDGPPPPNRAVASVPIYGDPYLYLLVSDWQADAAAPDVPYDLEVRVRTDPDTHEPSNLFVPDRERSDSVQRQIEAARNRTPIPVRDCTAGDCCGGGTWIEGAISYELDEDFYAYAHPCPGEDCTLRIHYDLDPGPVDFLFTVFRGNSMWFDTVVSVQEQESQPAKSGTFGGTTEDDACFYAFQGHGGGLYYTISVRDLATHRDWEPDQRYRFCIEKVANECAEPPCTLYEDGCGT
jgi:hypothetical protein